MAKIASKLILVLVVASAVFGFSFSPALAAPDCSSQSDPTTCISNYCANQTNPAACEAQYGINSGSGSSQNTASATKSVNNLISTILNILSSVVGVVAVIMIIIAGFRYISSGGSDQGIKGAKNTILYAVIGLVIVALAQIIVHFVLNTTSTAAGDCVANTHGTGHHNSVTGAPCTL